MTFRVLSSSELTDSQIETIRKRIGDSMPQRLYFEAGLTALHSSGLDNRLVGLGSDGFPRFLGIRFDQSVVTTIVETHSDAEINEFASWQTQGEIHLRSSELAQWKQRLGSRFKDCRTIAYMEATLKGAKDAAPSQVRQLEVSDLSEIIQFFQTHYPANVFSRWMLDLPSFGYFDSSKLVGVAGTHAVEAPLGAAMLGNFLTHPGMRSKGIAEALGAALLDYLFTQKVTRAILGANVTNLGAMRLYEKLGFKVIEEREEVELVPIT